MPFCEPYMQRPPFREAMTPEDRGFLIDTMQSFLDYMRADESRPPQWLVDNLQSALEILRKP